MSTEKRVEGKKMAEFKLLEKEQIKLELSGDGEYVIASLFEYQGYRDHKKYRLSDLPNSLISAKDLERFGIEVPDNTEKPTKFFLDMKVDDSPLKSFIEFAGDRLAGCLPEGGIGSVYPLEDYIRIETDNSSTVLTGELLIIFYPSEALIRKVAAAGAGKWEFELPVEDAGHKPPPSQK